jgi:GNAT superfamily N-acetyltransferase
MQLAVRTAVASDEETFVRAQVAGWQHAYQSLLPASYLHGGMMAERQQFWRELFEANRPHQWLAVAEAQGEVLGVTCAFSAIPITHGECCIDQLYVLPPHKRKGVGKKLIAAAAAWCEARGSDRVVLSVIEGNTDAVKFYIALGGTPQAAEPWLPPCGGSLPVLRFVWPDIRVLSGCAADV